MSKISGYYQYQDPDCDITLVLQDLTTGTN